MVETGGGWGKKMSDQYEGVLKWFVGLLTEKYIKEEE
jgi:hypothetical protein